MFDLVLGHCWVLSWCLQSISYCSAWFCLLGGGHQSRGSVCVRVGVLASSKALLVSPTHGGQFCRLVPRGHGGCGLSSSIPLLSRKTSRLIIHVLDLWWQEDLK